MVGSSGFQSSIVITSNSIPPGNQIWLAGKSPLTLMKTPSSYTPFVWGLNRQPREPRSEKAKSHHFHTRKPNNLTTKLVLSQNFSKTTYEYKTTMEGLFSLYDIATHIMFNQIVNSIAFTPHSKIIEHLFAGWISISAEAIHSYGTWLICFDYLPL